MESDEVSQFIEREITERRDTMAKLCSLRAWAAPALFCWLGLSCVPALCSDIGAGKAVFETKCQKCHGDDGRGNPSMAKLLKLKQPFTPLGTAEVQNKSDDELKQIAVNGVRTARAEMKPVKGGLTDAEASAVVNYLRTLK
jgi:mono/diheme cytochrome c family protein